MVKEFSSEIDMIFVQFGLSDTVPRPYRQIIVIAIFCMPIIMLFGLLCFCNDDESDLMPQPGTNKDPAHKAGLANLKRVEQREKIE